MAWAKWVGRDHPSTLPESANKDNDILMTLLGPTNSIRYNKLIVLFYIKWADFANLDVIK